MSDNLRNVWLQDFQHRLSLNMESVAGYGSSLHETQYLRKGLSTIIEKFSIKSMLDIPCADFYWMSNVNLHDVDYIGADLLEEQIEITKKIHPEKKFITLNMITDLLPKVDLIFTRDLFIHLSFDNIKKCIYNVKKSGSKYFMTSTYTKIDTNNELTDIIGWRLLNLQQTPFNFKEPLVVVDENIHTTIGKSMGVWHIDSLPDYDI